MKRSVVCLGVSALAVAAGAGAAVAQAETVTAVGTGQAEVAVSRPLTNAKIVRAVARARSAAVPRAFVNATAQASLLAETAHFVLGAPLAIDESAPGAFGYYGPSTFGRFGPNRYCGRVATVRRAPRVNGRPGRVLSRRATVKCFKPDRVAVTIAVTFVAAPNPGPRVVS